MTRTRSKDDRSTTLLHEGKLTGEAHEKDKFIVWSFWARRGIFHCFEDCGVLW